MDKDKPSSHNDQLTPAETRIEAAVGGVLPCAGGALLQLLFLVGGVESTGEFQTSIRLEAARIVGVPMQSPATRSRRPHTCEAFATQLPPPREVARAGKESTTSWDDSTDTSRRLLLCGIDNCPEQFVSSMPKVGGRQDNERTQARLEDRSKASLAVDAR